MSALHPAEEQARAAARARDAELDAEPLRRRAHGVVHTPPELARCVVAIADELLSSQLGLPLGAADPRLHMIDPACGPGAFLAATARLWAARGGPAGLRMSGIDLDADALARAAELAPHAPPGFALHRADLLREPLLLELCERQPRVLAILGNPPWITARADKTPEMQAALEAFRCDSRGVRLPERKLGVLSDAYVRFFRVCAEAARRSQAGALVALITNGSFLDGPVHRGMRAALRRWFDQLYVLDLGGSALLQRTAADRPERDDNVFGVRPSVSISWLCRLPGPSADSDRAGALSYARLWGTRSKKLEVLGAARFADLGFEPITPEPGHAFFVPRRTVEREYASWPSLADWMPFHREGVQTNRDHLAIDVDRSQLLQRLRAFASGAVEVAAPPRAHFNLAQARRNVAAALERDPDGLLGISVERIAYRPFDGRFFSPVAPLCHRPRPELLRAIAHAPQVLVSLRKDRGFSPYSHFGAADGVIDNCFLSTRSSCRARAFPACTPDGRGNLSLALADRASERAGEAVSPAQFQRYALAHLASPRYRRRFDAELHADYPRIPLPEGPERWRSLVAAGDALFQLLLAPLERPIVCDDAGQPEVRCGELRVLAADGCIVARGEQVLTASPAALGLWLGHLQPIKAYLASRAEAPFTPQLRATLQALVQRLESICRSIGHVDVWLELA